MPTSPQQDKFEILLCVDDTSLIELLPLASLLIYIIQVLHCELDNLSFLGMKIDFQMISMLLQMKFHSYCSAAVVHTRRSSSVTASGFEEITNAVCSC